MNLEQKLQVAIEALEKIGCRFCASKEIAEEALREINSVQITKSSSDFNLPKSKPEDGI